MFMISLPKNDGGNPDNHGTKIQIVPTRTAANPPDNVLTFFTIF